MIINKALSFSNILLESIRWQKLSITIFWFMLMAAIMGISESVKCLDCIGKDCMGAFCEGDYCLLGTYAPRWGTIEWGEPRVVKGCISGKMLENDIRSHCESADEDGEDLFTCFCDKDYCNNDKAVRRLEITPVNLVTCVCSGAHCKGNTCIGEMCSYVVNHRTKKSEQGCVNASVPLIERRSMGSCMIPPITGAMHHTVSKDPHALLATESCVCGTDYCNSEKPEVTIPEKMKCKTFVTLEAMGTTVTSKNTTCTGEFCFKAIIKSKIGHMTEYKTMGCASFLDGAELAEELQPVGCAKFDSEKVDVETCFQTNDKRAIGRARANQESVIPRKSKSGSRKQPQKTEKRPPLKPKMEVEYEDEEEQEENEDEENEENEKQEAEVKEESGEDQNEEEEKEEEEQEEKEEKNDDSKVEKNNKNNKVEVVESSTADFIFERPTEPPIPDDSNVTLVTVFVLLIILILVTGAIWKFKLHQRLFRSSYDTVAGG